MFPFCSQAFKILPAALIIGNRSYFTQNMGRIRKELLCPNSPNLLASPHLSPAASLVSGLSFLPTLSMATPPTCSETPVTVGSLQHRILPMSVQTGCCIPHLTRSSWALDPHPTATISSLSFPLQGCLYRAVSTSFPPILSTHSNRPSVPTTTVKHSCQSHQYVWSPMPVSRWRVVSHQASSVKCFRVILPVSEECHNN